jgi:hypothetical protein
MRLRLRWLIPEDQQNQSMQVLLMEKKFACNAL